MSDGWGRVMAAIEAAPLFVPPSPRPSEGHAGEEGEASRGNSEAGNQSPEASGGGAGRGMERPRLGGSGGEGNDDATIAYCAEQPENDTGNARRLLAWHGENFLNVRQVGWHRWTGTHFEMEDGEEHVTRFAQSTAALIAEEADYLGTTEWEAKKIAEGLEVEKIPPRERTDAQLAALDLAYTLRKAVTSRKKQRRKYATTAGNTQRLDGMVKQALPWRVFRTDKMDMDRHAINLINGTLRIHRVAKDGAASVDLDFAPHNRADRFTKVMPARYEPGALCPRWEEFLELTQPKEEMRLFLQTYAGACLLGARGRPVVLFHFGAGANGKSTFAEALRRIFGAYAQALNAEAFSGQGQKRGDQATPELAQLPGKRLVIVSELAEGEPVKEALIKALTGGEAVQARHLHGRFFDFVPVFRAMMSGNAMPRITGTDFGIWRRLKIVPWEISLPEPSQREMELVMAEFAEERAGILNWLLDGLERFLLEGLHVPPQVQELTESYRAEVDIVGSFIDACLEPAPPPADGETGGVRAGYLYKVFLLWCEENGVTTMKMARFGREMKAHGVQREDKRHRTYLGVRLVHNAPRPGMSSAGGDPDDFPD